MKTIRNLKTYSFLFIGMISLTSAIAMSSSKIRVFDSKHERFEFLSGDIILDLPGKSNRNLHRMYYKVLMDKPMSWEAGPFEISVVEVKKYKGPKEEELKNKFVVRTTKYVYPDNSDISRTAFWYGGRPVILRVSTSVMTNTFPTEAEKEARIKKDDEIFNHIVESFRYRKEDGTYAKPEIIRQLEEVKEEKSPVAEYHGEQN